MPKIQIALYFVLAGVIIVSFAFMAGQRQAGEGTGGAASFACATRTVTRVEVGTTSNEILPNRSNRAWARIQQIDDATSTVYLSFDEGAAAIVDHGLAITDQATSTVQFIDFGINTDFPYLGAVTGILTNASVNSASSTVLVTECIY